MTRIRITGLCLVAAMMLRVMVASTAGAGEAGICVKAAKVGKKLTGRFLDKNCTEKASEAQKDQGKNNKDEWTSAAGSKYASSTEQVRVASASGTIHCRKSSDVGEWTGWQTGVDTITLSDCALEGLPGYPCQAEGEPLGVIKTSQLATYLLDHGTKGPGGLEPQEGEVWMEYQDAAGRAGYQMTFECGHPEPHRVKVLFRTSGSVSGVVSPVGAMEKAVTTTFGAGKGEQALVTEFSYGEGAPWEPTGPNVESAVSTAKGTKVKLEIRACDHLGAVSEGKGALTCEHEEPAPW
jgi:hypothetical protein